MGDRDGAIVADYCEWARGQVMPLIASWVADHASEHPLYELLLDYPFRPAKGLRPALCLASCRALGGDEDAALPTASVVELLHNAFLIHDDVEDGSETRRGGPTLSVEHGVPIAINVGDGMLGLALVPLLQNTEVIGLGPSLAVLERITRTMLTTVEGQAVELIWIRDNRCTFEGGAHREAYEQMVRAKTAEYSFVAPVELGAMIAGLSEEAREPWSRYADHLGVAFQITDDLLNLHPRAPAYGKERGGDLWEGKRTLILLHALHEADADERARAAAVLAKPRVRDPSGVAAAVERLRGEGEISSRAGEELLALEVTAAPKTDEDVAFLERLIARHQSERYAREVAREHALAAERALAECGVTCEGNDHGAFLHAMVRYVVERLR